MKRMLPGMIAAVVLAIGLNVSTVSAAEKQEAKASTQLVTEGEFSKWLVQVLGLARVVSVAPSEQECFAVLLQNGVSPKDGWNATNVVTRTTLARVVVQALGWQGEVKDPGNDASWINFLKEKNLDISTIGAAVENLGPISEPLANQAVVVSTDPLGKVHEIRRKTNSSWVRTFRRFAVCCLSLRTMGRARLLLRPSRTSRRTASLNPPRTFPPKLTLTGE